VDAHRWMHLGGCTQVDAHRWAHRWMHGLSSATAAAGQVRWVHTHAARLFSRPSCSAWARSSKQADGGPEQRSSCRADPCSPCLALWLGSRVWHGTPRRPGAGERGRQLEAHIALQQAWGAAGEGAA